MKTYHVNPRTGNPALCHAEKGKCPFGAHTLDPVQCYAIYERVMADYTVPRPISKRTLRARAVA